jgi:hypothetical protein
MNVFDVNPKYLKRIHQSDGFEYIRDELIRDRGPSVGKIRLKVNPHSFRDQRLVHHP